MKININQQCKVTLTKFGATYYNKHMQQYRQFYCRQEGDMLVGELWQLMQIFGETLYNGMPEVPFKDCEMELVK